MQKCFIKDNPILKKEYEAYYNKLAPEIKQLNLAKPAQRALINHAIFSKKDLIKYHDHDLKSWHGIGKIAFNKIKTLL